MEAVRCEGDWGRGERCAKRQVQRGAVGEVWQRGAGKKPAPVHCAATHAALSLPPSHRLAAPSLRWAVQRPLPAMVASCAPSRGCYEIFHGWSLREGREGQRWGGLVLVRVLLQQSLEALLLPQFLAGASPLLASLSSLAHYSAARVATFLIRLAAFLVASRPCCAWLPHAQPPPSLTREATTSSTEVAPLSIPATEMGRMRGRAGRCEKVARGREAGQAAARQDGCRQHRRAAAASFAGRCTPAWHTASSTAAGRPPQADRNRSGRSWGADAGVLERLGGGREPWRAPEAPAAQCSVQAGAGLAAEALWRSPGRGAAL